jgi:hypothetical protein
MIPPAGVKPGVPEPRQIPFRVATLERSNRLFQDTGTITANTQPLERVLEGTGYLYDLALNLQTVTAGNSANVAYAEDGPWSALQTVALSDPTGQIVLLSGYHLYIANLINRQFAVTNSDADASGELYTATTGTGATGGSFNFWLHVPAGINRRSLLGMLGNQDRAVKYQLRTDIAPSAQIYATGPTNAGAFTHRPMMSFYTVPTPVNPQGFPQGIVPDGYGTLGFLTSMVSEAAPQPASTINHQIRRIGNTVRWYGLVFRAGSATPRATAQTNVNTVRLAIADAEVFNESYAYRRLRMWEQYGFRFPAGVLAYDFIHDFAAASGYELGDDWLNTRAVNTAQFEINYLAGFTTGGTLTILTSDLLLAGQPS